MRIKLLAATALLGSLSIYSLSHAEGRDEHGREGGGREGGHGMAPARAAPGPFQRHPAGVHPRGATVRPHATRVMAARVVGHGARPWHHWAHPEFARPVYYWDWATIHNVTCIAEDSYGDQYPVTEAAQPGWGNGNMTSVEDDALDRCNDESGGDQTCYLATCTHF